MESGWIQDKWQKKKEKRLYQSRYTWVAVVNTKTKQIISMIVTKEKVSDGRMLKPLVKQVPCCNVDKAIADGAYDTKDNFFRFLDSIGAEPVIKVRRSNASSNAHGCMPRRKMVVVVEQLQDVKRWKREKTRRIWHAMEDGLVCILLHKANVWRTCEICQVEEHGKRTELLLKASIYNTFLGMAA